ncbi:hypothetical protein BURK2_04077 [Burkholderiales bacterium]|nr:hypothetical protein BURK2_04077 [Burkholderiales bacterium]
MTSIPPRVFEYRQTARDIAGIFFVKKHVFLLTFIGVIIGALALSFLVPPIYEASTQLVVKPQFSKPLVFDQDTSRMNVFNEVNEQAMNTVIFLLNAPEVLREVVILHKLAPADDEERILEEIDSLRGRIKAEPLTMSSIVKLSMRGRNPVGVTEQLNTLVDAYIRHYIKVNQATAGRLQFFTEQTARFRDQYGKLNQELAEVSKNLDIIDPAIQKDSNLALIKELEISKSQLRSLIESLRSRAESFQGAMKRFSSEERLAGLPAETLLNYPALVEMEKSLAQLLIYRQRARNDFLPSAKQVQDADLQYANMKSEIRRNVEQIITDLGGQVASNTRAIQEMDAKINDLRRKSIKLTGDGLELDRLALEHKLTKDNYTLYATKQEEARINDEKDRAQFANVSVASRPSVPVAPWFPQKSKIMLLAFPLALMLALAFSAMSYAMEQRLWTPTDVALHTDLRVLGSLDSVGAMDRPGRWRLWSRNGTPARAT